MKMRATIELEFESTGETTLNAMDGALIRGLEALKKRHRAKRDRRASENYQIRVYKVDYCKNSPRLAQPEAKGQTHAPC
jgi:hypothetical protein